MKERRLGQLAPLFSEKPESSLPPMNSTPGKKCPVRSGRHSSPDTSASAIARDCIQPVYFVRIKNDEEEDDGDDDEAHATWAIMKSDGGGEGAFGKRKTIFAGISAPEDERREISGG